MKDYRNQRIITADNFKITYLIKIIVDWFANPFDVAYTINFDTSSYFLNLRLYSDPKLYFMCVCCLVDKGPMQVDCNSQKGNTDPSVCTCHRNCFRCMSSVTAPCWTPQIECGGKKVQTLLDPDYWFYHHQKCAGSRLSDVLTLIHKLTENCVVPQKQNKQTKNIRQKQTKKTPVSSSSFPKCNFESALF